MRCFYCALEGTGVQYDRRKPCPECQDWLRKGAVICIGVRSGSEGQSPVRSGQWAVVMPQALDEIPGGAQARENARGMGVMFVLETVWDRLGLDAVSMAAQRRN